MYHAIRPQEEDEEVALAVKWKDWARQESFKRYGPICALSSPQWHSLDTPNSLLTMCRLAYSVLEHDMHIAIVQSRNPTTSYTEFTAPLPDTADLWFASSAETWRQQMLELGHGDDQGKISLRDMLIQPSLLNFLPPSLDTAKARSVLLHGLAGQVFEYRKQSILHNSLTAHRSVGLQLAICAQQQELLQTLTQISLGDPTDSPESSIMVETLRMSLYVDVDDIQRFAGKDGVTAAQRAYQILENWFQDVQSRNAAWHAGQVLRAARQVPPRQLRGYESIMIYHATLVLWIYGVLHSVNLKQGNERDFHQSSLSLTPLQKVTSRKDAVCTKRVVLDGLMNQDTTQFLELGYGCPGLQSPSCHDAADANQSFCDLRHSDMIMTIGSTILEKHFRCLPGNEQSLPPLIYRLCNLMHDLGTLPKVAI